MGAPAASSRPPRPSRLPVWLWPLLVLAGFIAGELSGSFSDFNAAAGDRLLRWHVRNRPPPADIVIIDIDQASLDDPQMLELAGNWPWPRAIHGELLRFIAARQPAAIAFDLIFSEPDIFRPGSDALLGEALADTRALLPLIVAADGQATPLKGLPEIMGLRPGPEAHPDAALPLIAPKALPPATWRTGVINFLADDDRVGRRAWVRYPHAGWQLPSLAGRLVEQSGRPLPPEDSIALHWYGSPFLHLSYHALFLESLKENPRLPDLAGRLIIIGAAAPGLHDLRPTPLGASTPGPEILATAVANLREGNWLRPVGSAANLGLGLAGITAVLAVFRRRLHPAPVAGALLLVSLLAIGSAAMLLDHDRQWLPFSALGALWLAFAAAATASYLDEQRRREHAVRLFARFLDPHVVQSLTDRLELANAETGSSRQITILFSDIRGFTTLSETRRPEEVVALLNRYFDLQVAAVFEHGGTLDKFIGDAIMAFWNAPLDQPEHAAQAIRAALAMSRALEDFRRELGPQGTDFEIGIGLHSGPAVVGFLGSSQRLDYTAIGDTVNLASRIEGQTKGVARILVSAATRNAAGEIFDYIDHGEVTVKGRHQPVRLFEPREKPR